MAKYLKLSEETSDGCTPQVIPFNEADFALAVEGWFACKNDWDAGESFTVTVIEMSEEEFAELPEL